LWPGWRPVSELPLEAMTAEAASALVLRLYEARALELRVRPPRLVPTVSERPVASPLARLQLASGRTSVTNQRHVTVMLTDDLSRQFLQLLDGTRDRAAVLRDLLDTFDEERPPAWNADAPSSRLEFALMVDQGLDGNLAQMARLGLLVA